MQRQNIPSFGDAELEAWGKVLKAIEEAMDVDGLKLFDRGQLAELHSQAAWHVGAVNVVVPAEWSDADGYPDYTARMERWNRANAPGGVSHLYKYIRDNRVTRALIDADLVQVSEVALRSDADLLSLGGIGPKRLKGLREAILRYHADQALTVTR
jgi:hypothetical protein